MRACVVANGAQDKLVEWARFKCRNPQRGRKGRTMPHTTLDWFSLLGCVAFVYIVARLVVKIVYRIVCRAIEKAEPQNRDDEYANDPTDLED